MPDEENSQKVSKFNTAALINSRLHNDWVDALNCLKTGKFNKCDLILNNIWIELAGDLEDKTYEDEEKKLKKINDELGTLNDADSNSGFQEPSREDKQKRNKQYKKLVEKSLFLKRLEKLLGKGTSWIDDEEDLM